MKLMSSEWVCDAGGRARRKLMVLILIAGVLWIAPMERAGAAVSTTSVQGTVYLANGQPGSGMLHVSWPSFMSANGQSVVAGSVDVTIGLDGFLSVNLAANQGAIPAGLFYTSTFYMSDGSASTQYWVVPAAAQATLAQVQAQVMPAAQAVRVLDKSYVDQAMAQLSQSVLSGSGGTLTGPLYLSGDPSQPLQAANKHYVDSALSQVSSIVNPATAGQLAVYAANGTSINGTSKVPVASGGTGSATAADALETLGGISVSKTSTQSLSGALNLSGSYDSNTTNFNQAATASNVINVAPRAVTEWGAVGDCTIAGPATHAAQNLAAIQAALDWSHDTKSPIYFPTNPVNVGVPTIYCVSGTLNPKGASMLGPQRGEIVNVRVAVRGAPGKDVFAPGDPTSVGYVTPNKTFRISNLTIINDNSVDASASFPNRFPGMMIPSCAIDSGLATLTCPNAVFRQGDVGQNIRVFGAGAAGANLDTTVTAVSSFTQATLAATAGTTVTTAKAYLSVLGLSVTQTVGNCGWAYDNYTGGTYIGYGINKSEFENVDIISTVNTYQNNTCGFFFQGNASVYDTRWTHNYIQAHTFGMVFTGPTAGAMTGSSGMADLNVFDQLYVGADYAWLSRGGQDNEITGMQIFGRYSALNILDAVGTTAAAAPSLWTINVPQLEGILNPAYVSVRISGFGHYAPILETNGVLQWDAQASSGLLHINGPTFNLAGDGNSFTGNSWTTNPTTFNVTGKGNTYRTTCTGINANCPNKEQFAGLSAGQAFTDFWQPAISRSSIAYNRSADFLNKGGANYFFNSDDLWMWPKDLDSAFGWVKTTQADTDSETGSAIVVDNNNFYISGEFTKSWYYGKQLPAGRLRFLMRAKASATIASWNVNLLYNDGSMHTLCGITTALTTSYQTFSCDADSSAVSGKLGYLQIAASGDPAKTVSIAWFGINPYSDGLFSSFKLGTGTSMTGNHGTGTSVQHSDGTGATGGLAAYSADGSVTAGPTPPAGAMVGTTDAQTLTNKSIAGSEINSGTIGVAYGGTGQNESAATGIGQFSSGTYSVSTALANGTIATTQIAGDSSTKLATTGYVASPGAITPTTVTASGMVTGGNDATRTSAATIATTGFTSTGLVLPTVPVNTTKNGRCVVLWQMSSLSYTATFGLGMSNAPTGLWGGTAVTYAAAGTSNWLAFSQTATAATAVSTAVTAGAASTTYRAEIDFTLQTGATNPVAVTLYGLVSQASATLSIQPGSACYWLP